MDIHNRTDRSTGYAFILIFAIMAMGILLTGFFYYNNYERNFRAAMEADLSSIVNLKVGELEQWRKARLGDGALLFKNIAFSRLARRFLENPGDVDAQKQLKDWMGKYTTAYQYVRVYLVDTQGNIRMSVPEAPGAVNSTVARNVTEILRSGIVDIEDFHRNTPDDPIHLAVVVPIFDETDGGRPLGVLSLRIDPKTYLYSFISRWPWLSDTSETLLVRKDGADALFLSELRFRENASLNLRIPLTKTESPEVRAALGQKGIVEGVDYHGAQVVAAIRPVPGSPWAMVARVNTAEVYSAARGRLWETLAFIGLLLFGSGAAMAFLWRKRSEFYREREKVAEAVRESETRFRQLAEASFEGVAISEGGRFLNVNRAFLDMFGYKAVEELIGVNAVELVAPEYRQTVASNIAAGYEKPYETVGMRKDASFFPIEVNARMMEIAERRVRVTAIKDMTERKEAESALRRTRQLLDSVVENIPAMVFVKRARDLRFELFNRAGENLLGYSRADLIGKCDYDFFPKEEADFFTSVDRRVLDSHEILDIPEEPIRIANGETRYLHTWKIALRDETGDPSYLLGISLDITERKEAQEALARSEKKIRDITSVLGQGVYALDAAGRLTFINPQAERLLGWTEAELLGRDVHSLFHGKRDDGSVIKRGECPAHLALGTGQPQMLDGELLSKKDGGVFPASIIATPMMEEGRVAGVVVVFSDITERQRIMQEMTEAKERAEEATKLKDKFVSLVAHDLKSPFTGIIGLLEVMDEDTAHPLDERNKDILTHALLSGRQMLRMIDELLDISRLKTGKIIPHPRFFDGSVAAGMALARISQQAAAKGVAINNEILPGARLYADTNLFDEVLQNLLTNAVKFSARGGVVTVFSPGDGIVAVRDRGVGIKKNFLPFLFRHDEKTTSPGTDGELGTGLGLPLSHDMMTAMGGSLTVESEKGAGSVFYAALPNVVPVALIVDDQAPLRYLLRQHLSTIGVKAVEAEDGEQALSLIGKERPHLIITDITMPKMSGFDLLQAVRRTPETASLPVIVITADNQVESREKSFRMGADDFISKPLRVEDLIPRVRRLLG